MGGAEVFTYEVSKQWMSMGHDVTLFTSMYPDCKKEETLDGVKVIRSGGKYSVYHEAKKHYFEIFRHQNFDLIIDEINTHPFFVHTFKANNERTIALIHQLAREYWYYETHFPINAIGHFLENKWLQKYKATPTVTVSSSTSNDLLTLGFKQVSIVPEGLNFQPLSEMPQKSENPSIVYAGRLTHAKRPIHALNAFIKVKEKLPTAELWIIGDGPVRQQLEQMSISGVKFFGQTSTAERRGIIQQSWVLVNPSVREGWGLNVTEANALGVPSVAYDVPGLRDSVQNGITGLLVESGDVDALADGLLELLTDSKLRVDYSHNALAYSRKFSWAVTAREILKAATAT
jgi:glycosyltransferase involved in cell wall biosynthesis